MMTMIDLISAIEAKHKENGITVHPPASKREVEDLEAKIGFQLPAEFREFYSICNGFECNEDLFRMIPLYDVTERGRDYDTNWFHFAEYLTYCDMWQLTKTEKESYRILNTTENQIGVPTTLHGFLTRFLIGDVFDKGGLYDGND